MVIVAGGLLISRLSSHGVFGTVKSGSKAEAVSE